MTFVLGLTGQTGAGKTTVCSALRNKGIPVVDADVLARDVVSGSKSCLGDLVLEFGCDIIDHNGELNRRKLGAIVFSDKLKLRRLNAITFPHIVRRIEEVVWHYRKTSIPLLVLDAPTLYEAGVDRLCDAVVAVLAPEEVRLQRIMERDALGEEEARGRIRSQHSDAFFRARANFIVENTGTREELEASMDGVLGALLPEREESHETANV